MLEIFYPGELWDSAYEIPFERWKDRGVKGVIFDIDNDPGASWSCGG